MTQRSKVVALAGMVLLALILLYARNAASYFTARAIEKLFRDHAGITLRIREPAIRFFPLRFTAKKLSMHTVGESEREGITASRGTITVDLAGLRDRTLLLPQLTLDEVRIVSLSKESSFIRLIQFLAKNRTDAEGWKVSIPYVGLTPVPNLYTLEFGIGGHLFRWADLRATFDIPPGEPPSLMKLLGGRFNYAFRGNQIAHSIDFTGSALLGAKGVDDIHVHANGIEETQSRDQATTARSKGTVDGSGHILMNGPNRGISLTWRANQIEDFLLIPKDLVPERMFAGVLDGELRGKALGAVDAPSISLNLRARSAVDPTSLREIAASGSVEPFDFHVEGFFGEQPTPVASAELTSESIHLSLRESTTKGQEFSGEAKYVFGGTSATINEVRAKNYPVQRLVDLASPFLSAEAAQSLGQMVSKETLLTMDAAGEFSTGDKRIALKGTSLFTSVALPLAGPSVIEAKYSVEGSTTSIDEFTVASESTELRGSGTIGTDRVDIGLRLLKFDPLRNEELPITALFSGEGELSGTPSQLQLQAKVIGTHGQRKSGKELPSSQIQTQLRDSLLTVDGTLLGDAVSFSAKLPLARPASSAIKFDGKKFPLDLLNSQIDGDSQFSGEFAGDPRSPLSGTGKLVLAPFQATIHGTTVESQDSIEWKLRNGALDFGATKFVIGGKALALSGRVSAQDGWKANVGGAWDLAGFSPFVPALEQITGEGEADLEIRGAFLSPRVSGPLTIRRGTISIPFRETIIGVANLEADAEFDGSNIQIHRITAEMGDGEIKANGRVDQVLSSPNVRVHIDANGVQIEPADNFALRVNGEVDILKAPTTGVTLDGHIDVVEGLYQNTISLSKLLDVIRDLLSAKRNIALASSDKSVLDAVKLRLTTTDPILVDTNIVQAELRGDLLLLGDAGKYQASGDVQIENGAFSLGSNSFEVITGNVLFPGGPNSFDPNLNIVSESEVSSGVDSYRVRMLIAGSLQKPVVTFDSDGGLSQREVVNLLGSGQATNRVALLKADRAQEYRLDGLLNPRTTATLEERITGLTGFTSVEVGSSFSLATGENVPRLFAERPIAGPLKLNLESELGGQRANIIGLDYPIAPKTSLNFGWRNAPTTRRVDTESGSFDFGVRYQSSYSGVGLLPPLFSTEGEK